MHYSQTTITLAKLLLHRCLQIYLYLVGTVRSNRTGFLAALKNVKALQRYGERGDIRYVRDHDILYVQWLDKRAVTLLSSMHRATEWDDATRTARIDGHWVQQQIRRPAAVASYNEYMGGVDQFDQLASTYRLLRRAKKSWKCLFYDLIECAVINSFILMTEYCSVHPGVFNLPSGYAQDDFRVNLAHQLNDIELDDQPPLLQPGRKKRKHSDIEPGSHLPMAVASDNRGMCAVCWRERRQRVKSMFRCTTCANVHGNPLFLCINNERQQHHQNL